MSTFSILNTIKPVDRVFTAMDAANPVSANVLPQGAVKYSPCPIDSAPRSASQVASRGDKLPVKLVYEMKIDLLTYECDCQD